MSQEREQAHLSFPQIEYHARGIISSQTLIKQLPRQSESFEQYSSHLATLFFFKLRKILKLGEQTCGMLQCPALRKETFTDYLKCGFPCLCSPRPHNKVISHLTHSTDDNIEVNIIKNYAYTTAHRAKIHSSIHSLLPIS